MAVFWRALIVVVFILFSVIPLAHSEVQDAIRSFNPPEITEKIAPAVVLIKGRTEGGDLLGTGFIISSDGKIATNLHVIETLRTGGAQLASGEKYDSFSILAFDVRKEIAIIKIPGFDLPFVSLGNSNNVEVGEPFLLVGNTLGLQGSVTTGVVSSVRDDPGGGGSKCYRRMLPRTLAIAEGPLSSVGPRSSES